jgi:filamentous hemagglutinin
VLRRAGYDDAEVGLQGSAVTGFRESDASPFDSGRVSDFDVAVVSPTLFAEANSQGIQVRASGAVPHAADHTTFALTPDQAAALGVGDLALPKTWRPFGDRRVNVMVFARRAAAIAKEPHTIWAR